MVTKPPSSMISDFAAAADARVAPAIFAATSKVVPVDADTLGLTDSADTNKLKKLTWANLKAALLAYFNSSYAGITECKLLAEGSTTAVAGLTLDLSAYIAAGYRRFELEMMDTKPVADAVALVMEVSTDGGASWLNSAYKYVRSSVGVAVAPVAAGEDAATFFFLVDGTGNAAGEFLNAFIDISISADRVFVASQGTRLDASTVFYTHEMRGTRIATSVNAIRVRFSSNIASGKYRLRGFKAAA
ncbi:hypothetical protein J2X13_005843 [Aminobacter aminovorans]|nr:hypothetical protein [Aminobacter aminovorans]